MFRATGATWARAEQSTLDTDFIKFHLWLDAVLHNGNFPSYSFDQTFFYKILFSQG